MSVFGYTLPRLSVSQEQSNLWKGRLCVHIPRGVARMMARLMFNFDVSLIFSSHTVHDACHKECRPIGKG